MIADRWMMESRRLVNWGSYEGYHDFRPSTDSQLPVTLLAGASESGKSTLVDAQISLLYPTGTPFNKASNSGRSERSDYTYLRGMIGVGGSDGVDEPMYLRGRDESGAPRSIWGAIVDTYRNFTTGQILSCGKFLYLMPGDGRGDVRRLYLAWDKPIDPRRMDVFRESSFTPTQLKSTYPGCVTFPNAEAFHTHIWDVLGLSAEACRLLARIQSADAPSRLDDIFKQGVLGVPEALDLARATVEDYERYDANFRSMEEKTRRMGKLRAITASYGDYESARDAVHSFDAVNPATKSGSATIRAWAIRRMIGEVSERQPLDRRLRDERRSEARAAGKRIESLRTRIDAVRERMRGLDGGDLTRLDAEMRQAERALADITAGRQRIGRMFEAAGEEFPKDEHAWDERRIEAVTFMRSYEQRKGLLDDMRNQTYAAHASVKQTLQRLNDDYERQKSQRTRISRQMDETRAMLCRATGLGPSELPYVAELMDVREDQEHWRLAMNAAYGSMAQTRVIGTLNDRKAAQTDDDLDGARCAFASCAAMIDMLRREIGQIRDVNGVKSYGARNLDPRCRSSFYALVRHSDGQVERITSTGGRSGGALQELTSFVYGAALIYLLGGGMDNKLKPSYTTLFLDEALIKADGRYTRRALSVLPRLGFQVIVSAPESKTGEILEVSTKAYVTRKDPDTGYTTLHEARLDGIDEMDGADEPEGTVESDDAAE